MRVIIFGNSGSGKSTMAKNMVRAAKTPCLSLDDIAWDEPGIRKPLTQSIHLLMEFINENESWIIEGCYSDIIEAALPHCEELRFLNPGIDVCIKHCYLRPWEPEKFESPEKQDRYLQNLLDWVKKYNIRDDEYELIRHRVLFDSFLGKKESLLTYQNIQPNQGLNLC